jgi:hypothetical protein
MDTTLTAKGLRKGGVRPSLQYLDAWDLAVLFHRELRYACVKELQAGVPLRDCHVVDQDQVNVAVGITKGWHLVWLNHLHVERTFQHLRAEDAQKDEGSLSASQQDSGPHPHTCAENRHDANEEVVP